MDKKRLRRVMLTMLGAVVVALAMTLVFTTALADKAQPAPIGPGGCMEDICTDASNYVCTANDTKVAIVRTVGVGTPCQGLSDETTTYTGTYYFTAEFVSGAQSRYDPGVWLATAGGDGRHGACYFEYITSTLPLTTTQPTVAKTAPPWDPYWDNEEPYGTDFCGDLTQDITVTKPFGPVVMTCVVSNTEGSVDACLAWDNHDAINCPANNNCPGTGSKCSCGPVPFDLNVNQVDLGITKTVSAGTAPNPDTEFTYTLEVYNVEPPFGGCETSIGHEISDTLSIWLKPVSLPTGPGIICSQDEDDTKVCSQAMGGPGCDGYGDIVQCSTEADLDCGDPPYVWEIPVMFWTGDPASLEPGDPRAAVPPPHPFYIPNTACVQGFQPEPDTIPAAENNCDNADIPTAVELDYVAAKRVRRTVELAWETLSEQDNAYFNVYRATSPGGPRTLIAEKIPAAIGAATGAEYSYVDKTVGEGSFLTWVQTYYYWVEDVDIYGNSEMLGPLEASLPGMRWVEWGMAWLRSILAGVLG